MLPTARAGAVRAGRQAAIEATEEEEEGQARTAAAAAASAIYLRSVETKET